MLNPRFIARGFAICSIALAPVVSSQDFPTKPIRILTSGAGGGNDFVARLIAQGLTGGLREQVIVENRASLFIPGQTVAQALPDGYTLLLGGGAFLMGPLLQKSPYDTVRDFAPITWVIREPSVLVVNPQLPAKSVKELIALAKAKPGELNYASVGAGSTPHLVAELFRSMADIKIVHIPYKGTGPAIIDVISGQAQLVFFSASATTPHIKAGRLRALAVTTVGPSALFPDLPPMAATLPGYESVGIGGVWAPARTPPAIVRQLNQEIVRVINAPDIKEKFLNSGSETVGSSPEEFSAKIKSELAKWSKVIKDAGIKPDSYAQCCFREVANK